MTLFNWLSLLSVPALIGGLWKWFGKRFDGMKARSDAVELGVQALLRAQMITEYQRWDAAGYCPIWARANWENMYTRYHALGANGVMDDIRTKFLALPTREG